MLFIICRKYSCIAKTSILSPTDTLLSLNFMCRSFVCSVIPLLLDIGQSVCKESMRLLNPVLVIAVWCDLICSNFGKKYFWCSQFLFPPSQDSLPCSEYVDNTTLKGRVLAETTKYWDHPSFEWAWVLIVSITLSLYLMRNSQFAKMVSCYRT